jgi:hypothetical protein
VSFSHKNRPDLSRFTFVFLGLAISVFTWGLQYKLSLYDPPQSTSHEIPEAKLLSKNEQTTVGEGLFIGTAVWPLIAQVSLLGLLGFALLGLDLPGTQTFSYRGREAKRPWRFSCRSGLNAFFFRPPPSLT